MDRFEFSGKYAKPLPENNSEICIIYPTNSYDVLKLTEISNYFKIPIMFDINYHQNNLKSPHFKVDMSKYDKIVNIDSMKKLITLEPGVKIFHLLTFLEKFNLTIPTLENYKFSTLTIGDILFNNFYSFNQGKFIDDLVTEILVCTPRKNKILNLSQNDDLTLTGLNLKNLFLRTNSTLGIIIEIKIKLNKLKDYKYLTIQSVENKIDDNINIVKALNETKKDLGLSDVLLISKENETDLILKIKNKHLENCIEILKSTNIQFEQISKDEYLKFIVLSNSPHSDIQNILRKLKINLHKKSIPNFLKKAEKLAEENKIDMQFRCSYNNDEIEMIVKSDDDIQNIEKAFKYINKIHNNVLKVEGNIFVNNNIKVNTKYHLMRDIGVENYLINEEVKYLFDPNCILNPHLSIRKPESPFKTIKRNNKVWNYLLTKLEI